jgi:peptide subunit release factor 1 (eRF1)
MAMKAGVWIDHKQAILVLITDTGKEIKKIKSGVGMPARTAAGSRPKNKFTPQGFGSADRHDRKLTSHLTEYYDEVIARLRGAEAILILGPGEAKGEFIKRVNSKKLGGVVEVETTDKMTDRQIADKVSQHFAKTSATSSGSPKSSAENGAKATSRSASKRSAK